MEILHVRKIARPKCTISNLTIDTDPFACFILEDPERFDPNLPPDPKVKVYGQTAIPCERYLVLRTMSNRFGRVLPLLINVPCFDGIRCHPGNVDTDTDGCVLPGDEYVFDAPWRDGTLRDQVLRSVPTFQKLDAVIAGALARGDEVWWTIKSECWENRFTR